MRNEEHDSSQSIEQIMKIAHQTAARLKRSYSWVDAEDLHAYALLALTMISKCYSAECGIPFAKFAGQRLLHNTIDEMRKDRVLFRKNSKVPRTILMSDFSRDATGTPEMSDRQSHRPMDVLEARDICTQLLRRLSPCDRRLLMMYYDQQLTFREIGEVFGISESAAFLRHKALMERLRRMARASEQLPPVSRFHVHGGRFAFGYSN